MRQPGRRAATAAVLALGAAGLANAADFAVNPVRLTLHSAHAADALNVVNQGAERATVEVELDRWQQKDGEDVLVPADELIATPLVMRLEPGASQVIRVALRKREVAGGEEQPYRLVLQEVPPPPKPDDHGLRTVLRITLPIFVLPPGKVAPSLRWEVSRSGLVAHNDGTAHVQVTSVRLAGGDTPLPSVSGYLLAGQRREWKLPQDLAVGSMLHLVAQTDAGEMSADVLVTAP